MDGTTTLLHKFMAEMEAEADGEIAGLKCVSFMADETPCVSNPGCVSTEERHAPMKKEDSAPDNCDSWYILYNFSIQD